MFYERITPRTSSPISLALAKQHCRVEVNDDDALLDYYILAALDHVEGPSGVGGWALLEQEWMLRMDAFPASGRIRLEVGPVISITQVSYVDAAAETHIVPSAQYQLIGDCLSAPAGWPYGADVKIGFQAGFGAAAGDVPADIGSAMLHLISHWYENREAVTMANGALTVPLSFDAMISAKRRRAL